jgi:hypothetical protein
VSLLIERALGGGDQQAEHQRRERRDHADGQLDHVARVAAAMVVGQCGREADPEEGAAEDAYKGDAGDRVRAHHT